MYLLTLSVLGFLAFFNPFIIWYSGKMAFVRQINRYFWEWTTPESSWWRVACNNFCALSFCFDLWRVIYGSLYHRVRGETQGKKNITGGGPEHYIQFSSRNGIQVLNAQFRECCSVSSVQTKCSEAQFVECLGKSSNWPPSSLFAHPLPTQLNSVDTIQLTDGSVALWILSI